MLRKFLVKTGFYEKHFPFVSIFAFILSIFTSCAKGDVKNIQSNSTKTVSETHNQEGQNNKQKNISVKDIVDSTSSTKNCGPYPGYPCGTRYYTVSIKDFRLEG